MKYYLSALVLLGINTSSIHAACSPGKEDLYPSTDGGCLYPACSISDPDLPSTNPATWRCVHDSSFCTVTENYFVSASNVVQAGRECTCEDILDYPSLIGICDNNGFSSPMVTERDCAYGNPVCDPTDSNSKGNVYLAGKRNNPFTSCDLKCDYQNGHTGRTPEDTYQQCAVPEFEWTTASISDDGSMEAHELVIIGETLYAGGQLFSFSNMSEIGTVLKGPFTADDPTSELGASVEHFAPYEDIRRPYDCAVAMIDKTTGEPKNIVSISSSGTCYINAMTSGGTDIIAAGDYANNGVMNITTELCTEVIDGEEDGKPGASTACENGRTIVTAHPLAYTGFVFSMKENGDIRWLVQPWLVLRDDLKASDFTWYEISVTGVSTDDNNDIYVTGYRASQEGESENTGTSEKEPNVVYYAMITKLNGHDGSVIWEKEFPEAKHTLTSVYDSEDDSIYFTAEIVNSNLEESGELKVTCSETSEGCNLLARASASTGSIEWVRYAHGTYGVPWNHGDVELATVNDGPYIYAAYHGVGSLGPSSLDLGTSYAGCERDDNFVAEFDPELLPYVVDQSICDSLGLGTYYGRDSNKALSAYVAHTRAVCMGNENGNCLVKYHKRSGLPVWGSDKPRIYAFRPLDDGIYITGSHYGPVKFDSITVAGPLGSVDGYDMVYQSKLDLDGNGLYAQPIIADRSWAAGSGMTSDSESGDVYITFFTSTRFTHLGPGAPGGFIQDIGLDICEPEDQICEDDYLRLVVAKLGDEKQPFCIDSCGKGPGNRDIAKKSCYIDQVCYNKGDTAAPLGLNCKVCDPKKSQTEWTDSKTIGDSQCYVDGLCLNEGDAQATRVGRWDFVDSVCSICLPGENEYDFSVADGFVFNPVKIPPQDCRFKSASNNFIENKKAICDPTTVSSFSKVSKKKKKTCAEKCTAEETCTAFQLGKKSCFLYQGIDVKAIDSTITLTKADKQDCYVKESNGWEKLKGKICRPSSAYMVLVESGSDECKDLCWESDKCTGVQISDGKCILFKKKMKFLKKGKDLNPYSCFTKKNEVGW